MAKVLVTEDYLEDIADAIRGKLSSSDTYTPGQMAGAIESIPTGGITPTGTINITENGTVDVTQYATANVNVSGGSRVLPVGFTELEYLIIGSNRTYIGVPFIQRQGDRLITKAVTDWTQAATVAFGGLKTSFGQSSGYRGNWHVVSSKRNLWADGGLVEYLTSDPTIIASGNTAVPYGETLSPNTAAEVDITFNSNASAAVVYLYHGAYSSGQYCRDTNLYGAQIIRASGQKIVDLVPCKRDVDSICGFYDLAQDVFLTAIEGSFTAGPDA